MQPRVVGAFDTIAEHVNRHIDEIEEEDPISAAELWENVLPLPGGQLKAIDDETVLYVEDKTDIWNGYSGFPRSYGVDASTTRDISFQNGLILDVANAAFGVKDGRKELNNHRTIVAGIYYDDGVEKYENETVYETAHDTEYGPVHTRAEVVFLPSSQGFARSTSEWVSAAAQSLAEGGHLTRYVDEADGPLFLDGALYPQSLISRILFVKRENTYVPPEWTAVSHDIVQNYIDAVESQLNSGHPIIAVSKTMNTTEILNALEVKQQHVSEDYRMPWVDDYRFVSDLLNRPQRDNQTYTYTSWLVQEKDVVKNRAFEPLEPFDFRHFDPRDLRRAYFFVRIPRYGNIFRVETPWVFLQGTDQEDRENFQQAIIREMIETRDIPRATKAADKDARIGRDVRDRIKKKMPTITSITEYNRDVRWTSLAFRRGDGQ